METSPPVLRFACGLFAVLALLPSSARAQGPLRVDAFGYEPLEHKRAILRQAVVGFDAPDGYTAGSNLHIRRSQDDVIVATVPIVPWNGGAVHADSGDRTWSADFSELTTEGTYYAEDAGTGARSEDFDIRRDVFREVRRAAVRSFYYQRCGTAKPAAFADDRWSDGPCHLGPDQDLECRRVGNPNGAAFDLSGGWHDAGDYNKYINFADGPVHALLGAYQVAPGLWTDDFNLPESGNGVPDLLDEIRYELEWFLRMQRPNGSVLHKVSVAGFGGASPPSADSSPRFHGGVTASATASATAAFARAAYVFGTLSDAESQAFTAELTDAALRGWNWLQANPADSSYDNAGFDSAPAEDSPWEQQLNRVLAAAWLALLTDEANYHSYVADHYDSQPAFELLQGWTSPYQVHFTESLLFYASSPGADPGVAVAVRSSFRNSMQGYWLGAALSGQDAYQAWMAAGDHIWGSNRTRCSIGLQHALMSGPLMADFGPGCDATLHRQVARDHAHWLHGRNPLGLTFLSNMDEYGAPASIEEIYHGWFYDGTIWDNTQGGNPGPAPGYLSGGANRFFAPAPQYNGPPLEPPMGQPAQKSYLDWNADWPEESWEVTEPAIDYQGQYVRLLAEIAPRMPFRPFCPPTPNSSGQRTRLEAGGSPSVSAADLRLEVTCGPGVTPSLAIASPLSTQLPFGNGSLCIDQAQRVPPVVYLDASGAATLLPDPDDLVGPSLPGTSWSFQLWFRDPAAGGSNFNFSNALELTWTP